MSAEFSDDEIAFIRRAHDSDVSRSTLAPFEIAALTEANARALATLRMVPYYASENMTAPDGGRVPNSTWRKVTL